MVFEFVKESSISWGKVLSLNCNEDFYYRTKLYYTFCCLSVTVETGPSLNLTLILVVCCNFLEQFDTLSGYIFNNTSESVDHDIKIKCMIKNTSKQ